MLPSFMSVVLVGGGLPCRHGWGSFGWYLSVANPAALETHDHFIWLTSAVNGPHLPVYAKARAA